MSDDARRATELNEQARLYPWTMFNQREIEIMTRLPRIAVQRAFEDPGVPCQFGKARPEVIVQWVRQQEAKITVEGVRGKR